MVAGTAFGLLMGLKRNIEIFFDSWIMVLLTVPAVCWAFLSVLWFGISDAAPILTIVLIVFPFVVMNVWEGTKAMEKDLIEMGDGLSRPIAILMLRKVFIPQLMPYIFSSLRIALSLSWKIALVAEAFGGGSGVGQELINWFQDTRVDMMLAWGVSFMIVMVADRSSGVSRCGRAALLPGGRKLQPEAPARSHASAMYAWPACTGA